MEDDWETAEIKELPLPVVHGDVNKWAGEDEDDNVKDSWEDEDEEEPETVPPPQPAEKVKSSKALKAALEKKLQMEEDEEEERWAKMSPAERKAEQERIVKESDLEMAIDNFGLVTIDQNESSLDKFDPKTKEDFTAFSDALSTKLANYKDSPHFSDFVDDFVRKLCVNLPAAGIKKIKINVELLHSEKLKLEKAAKKPLPKGKGRAVIRTEEDAIESYQKYHDDYDVDGEFM